MRENTTYLRLLRYENVVSISTVALLIVIYVFDYVVAPSQRLVLNVVEYILIASSITMFAALGFAGVRSYLNMISMAIIYIAVICGIQIGIIQSGMTIYTLMGTGTAAIYISALLSPWMKRTGFSFVTRMIVCTAIFLLSVLVHGYAGIFAVGTQWAMIPFLALISHGELRATNSLSSNIKA